MHSSEATSQFLLPLHLSKQLLMLAEEVVDFAVLIVALGHHKHSMLRLWSQVLTDLRNGKHDLLHRAVAADYFDLAGML